MAKPKLKKLPKSFNPPPADYYILESSAGQFKIDYQTKKIYFESYIEKGLKYEITFPNDWGMTRVWQHVQSLIDSMNNREIV